MGRRAQEAPGLRHPRSHFDVPSVLQWPRKRAAGAPTPRPTIGIQTLRHRRQLGFRASALGRRLLSTCRLHRQSPRPYPGCSPAAAAAARTRSSNRNRPVAAVRSITSHSVSRHTSVRRLLLTTPTSSVQWLQPARTRFSAEQRRNGAPAPFNSPARARPLASWTRTPITRYAPLSAGLTWISRPRGVRGRRFPAPGRRPRRCSSTRRRHA